MLIRPLLLALGLTGAMVAAWGLTLPPADPARPDPLALALDTQPPALPGPDLVFVAETARPAPLYEETLGEAAAVRTRLDELLDSRLAEARPDLLLYARDRFQCWAAGDPGRFATCRAQALAALDALDRLEADPAPLVLAKEL